MINCTPPIADEWPQTRSDFINTFEFEIFNFVGVCQFVAGLGPWVIITAIVYLVGVVFLGQKLMENRPAWHLRTPLCLWNLMLALCSVAIFLRSSPETFYLLRQPDGMYKTFCTLDVHSQTTSFWCLVMVFTKFLELGDTVFVVLRKQKLIFLHWYHHLSVLLICFLYYDAMDPGLRVAMPLNSLVHSFMYTYYALRAIGLKLPKKIAIAITSIQLFQFLLVLVCNVISYNYMLQGRHCERHNTGVMLVFAVGLSYLILFGNFFVQTYIRGGKTKPKMN